VEPKTALAARIKKGKDIEPVSGQAARHFEMLMDAVAAKGWQHYEISNYCLPGNYARHNTGYWKNQPYLGIGPSAHSYNRMARQWNVANNAAYVKAIEAGQLPQETETLTKTDLLNEYIMTGLRTQWGIDTEHIQKNFGEEMGRYILAQARPFIEKGLLIITGNTITLSREGKLLADAITAELFIVDA
jgi:oxygen-independent coproporphyrinogen-3 oxidase